MPGDDADNATSPGTYNIGQNVTTNVPVNLHGVIIVLVRHPIIFQMGVFFDNSVYVRRYFNAWNDWKKIGPA